MMVSYDCLEVTMANSRHFSKQRVWKREKLLEYNMPNNDGIHLVRSTSDTKIAQNGVIADDGKLLSLRKKSSPRWL